MGSKRWMNWMGITPWLLGALQLAPHFVIATPTIAAEKIYINYGPFEVSLPISALELYAREGTINADLQQIAAYLPPDQMQQFREILQSRVSVTPVAVAQFLYSPQGEILLQRLGEIVQTPSRQSGFYAIRAALILAAADPEGLSLLKVLEKFPTASLRINSAKGFENIEQLTGLIRQTETAITAVEQQALAQQNAEIAANNQNLALVANPHRTRLDIRQAGNFTWEKSSFELIDPQRDRRFPVDLYLPRSSGKVPLVVISHGLGGSRSSFDYLARHLASYGFAVAVPEHPGSNAEQIQALINGLASEVAPPEELIDRPLDIQRLLDYLSKTYGNRLNMQQVGVLGQSFGGYTALALAGANLNFERLQESCNPDRLSLNLSLLLQCRATVLAAETDVLQDQRISAAIAINPITSTLFGPTEMAKIQVPILMVASSDDSIAPALPEQIEPFTWLTPRYKYLALLKNGSHFSTIAESAAGGGVFQIPASAVGPDPTIAFAYLRALTLAFFKVHLAQESQYQQYLTASYAQSISQGPLPLTLIQSLSMEQLKVRSSP